MSDSGGAESGTGRDAGGVVVEGAGGRWWGRPGAGAAWSDRLGWSLLSAGIAVLLPNVLTNGAIGYQQVSAICFLGTALVFATRVWRLPSFEQTRLYRILRIALPAATAAGVVLAQLPNLAWPGLTLAGSAAVATALTSSTSTPTRLDTLLSAALIGLGIALIGGGAAFLANSDTALGAASIGFGIVGIGAGAAFLANSNTALAAASIGFGIVGIGAGAAFLANSNTALAATSIGFGIVGIGAGAALLSNSNTALAAANIGCGIVGIGGEAALLANFDTAFAAAASIGCGIALIGCGAALLANSNTAFAAASIGGGIACIGGGAALLANSNTALGAASIGGGIACIGAGSWRVHVQVRSGALQLWAWLSSPKPATLPPDKNEACRTEPDSVPGAKPRPNRPSRALTTTTATRRRSRRPK